MRFFSYFLISTWTITLFSVHDALADDWFCTESAGRNSNDRYEICGLATGESEAEARASAFDAAKAEFNRVCNEDIKCKDSGKTLGLKRTECRKSPTGYICYRMLEYTLTEINPVSAASLETIQQELEKKQKQLAELRRRAVGLEQLKIANNQIRLEQKRIENLEGNSRSEIEKDIDRLTVQVENGSNQSLMIKSIRDPMWVFRLGISASGPTLKGHTYELASYRLELERRFTGLLGLSLAIDPYAVGHSTSKEKYTSLAISAGFPIYVFANLFVRPEAIQRSTKFSPAIGEQNFNQAGYGLSIGYDFAELIDSWNAGISLNIGFHSYQNSGATEGCSALSGVFGLAIAY
jgi:hypothetical protein